MKTFIIICVTYYFQTVRCSKYIDLEQDYENRNNYNEYADFEKGFIPAVNALINKKRLKSNIRTLHGPENNDQTGDTADLFGTNIHYRQPENDNDFNKRFLAKNPYREIGLQRRPEKIKANANYLTPMKASPEFVLAVAKESALLEAASPINPSDDVMRNNILRTGDYWDSVWTEGVDDPAKILRSKKDEKHSEIEMVQATITPGSKLYHLISVLKQISPRLLYVINKQKKK